MPEIYTILKKYIDKSSKDERILIYDRLIKSNNKIDHDFILSNNDILIDILIEFFQNDELIYYLTYYRYNLIDSIVNNNVVYNIMRKDPKYVEYLISSKKSSITVIKRNIKLQNIVVSYDHLFEIYLSKLNDEEKAHMKKLRKTPFVLFDLFGDKLCNYLKHNLDNKKYNEVLGVMKSISNNDFNSLIYIFTTFTTKTAALFLCYELNKEQYDYLSSRVNMEDCVSSIKFYLNLRYLSGNAIQYLKRDGFFNDNFIELIKNRISSGCSTKYDADFAIKFIQNK